MSNDSLTIARLATRLLKQIREAEDNTVTGDDAMAEILALILTAFTEVSELVEQRLVEAAKEKV